MDLEKIVDEAIDMFPDKVNNYKLGNKGVIGLFVGEAMKKSKGMADPKELHSLIKEKLDKK